VVASNRPQLPQPDWSIAAQPGFRTDLCRFLQFSPAMFDGLHLAGRAELGPLLESYGQPNSDFYPVLDLGAERARFRKDYAAGFPALSNDWFNLLTSMRGRRVTPGSETGPSIPGNPRVRAQALAALLRSPAGLKADDPIYGPVAREAAFRWQVWNTAATDQPPTSWELWLERANQMYRYRNGGTAGTADTEFYAKLNRYMERHRAPRPARDAVAFRQGIASWDFALAAQAAERLIPLEMGGHRWLEPDELRDGAVMAQLHLGDAKGARRSLDGLARFSTRNPGDLRSLLLESYVRAAESRPASAER
ncbi:MAG TPA: hypothetical protein VGP44_04755, partial [Gemmatimonadales bacterium]|nr:hypothetical protein [Gemmatimonadales bacterium]